MIDTDVITPMERAAYPEEQVNNALAALGHQGVYAYDHGSTSGLTFAYYGGRGRFVDTFVNGGTLVMVGAGSPTPVNYIVVNKTTGAISVSQTITNWNDTAAYARAYIVLANASTIDHIYDYRSSQYGTHASGSVSTVPAVIQIACSDETTPITAGNGKATFRMPYAMTLSSVRGSLTNAATGSPTVTVTIDINENGSTILSTKLTIDHSEKTSTTAVIPAVISDASLSDDSEMTIDFDVAGGGATGVKVSLIGTRAV